MFGLLRSPFTGAAEAVLGRCGGCKIAEAGKIFEDRVAGRAVKLGRILLFCFRCFLTIEEN